MLSMALQMLLTNTDALVARRQQVPEVGAMQLHHAQGPADVLGILQSGHDESDLNKCT